MAVCEERLVLLELGVCLDELLDPLEVHRVLAWLFLGGSDLRIRGIHLLQPHLLHDSRLRGLHSIEALWRPLCLQPIVRLGAGFRSICLRGD